MAGVSPAVENQGATLPAGGIKVKRMGAAPRLARRPSAWGINVAAGCGVPPQKESDNSAFPVLTVL